MWLDLELLCLHPEPVERLATQLAARLAGRDVEAVCGPLVEGAFVALTVARELAVPFAYAERFVADEKLALEAIASLPNEVWPPSDCPLCARGVPLEDLLEF